MSSQREFAGHITPFLAAIPSISTDELKPNNTRDFKIRSVAVPVD